MFHDCCPGFSYWPAGWFAASRYQKSVLAVLNYFLGVTFTDQSPAWHSISEKQNNMVPVFMVIGQGHAYFSRLIFRSEEHTSDLQSLMRISYDVFCLKKKNTKSTQPNQMEH